MSVSEARTPLRFVSGKINGVLVSEYSPYNEISPQIFGLDGSYIGSWGDVSLHRALLAKADDGSIFAATKDGNVRKYLSDGTLVWEKPFLRDVNGFFSLSDGSDIFGIIVVGNTVVVSGECRGHEQGSHLLFYNAETGELLTSVNALFEENAYAPAIQHAYLSTLLSGLI